MNIDEAVNKFTTHILKCGVDVSNYDFFRMSSVFQNGKGDVYKITWNLREEIKKIIMEDGTIQNSICCYNLHESQKEHIGNFFCVDGWKKEEEYYPENYDSISLYCCDKTIIPTDLPEPGMSANYGDIQKYTKTWVDYLTFQHSRIILH